MSQAGINSSTSAPPPPAVATQYTTDAGVAVPALNNLNVFGGVGASTSGAGSTITITVDTSAFDWAVVTSATNPNALVKEHGYIAKGASSVTFILPAAAAIGDTFIIAGYANLWSLTQNAGQLVIVGNMTTTIGVGGSITATAVSDNIELVCVTANTEFKVINMIGNPAIV